MTQPTQADLTDAAMCLWEEIVQHRNEQPYAGVLENVGTVALRHSIAALADPCCQEWEGLSRDEQDRRVPFDWEWCPYFLTERVTWTLTGPEYKGVGK